MKLITIYQHLLILHCVAFIICENFYSIISPGVIKSNRKYTVGVSLHKSSAPCTIRISISGSSFNATDQVDLQPFETKKLDFFPSKVDESEHQLLAEGLNGCKFRNGSKLLSKGFVGPKIYIQTDKAVYKPLDLVQFRVVILDEHTRPVNIKEPIRVGIFDNNNNRVKQFKDIKLTRGVFTGKFKLSERPVMGSWEIKVVIGGKYSHEGSKPFSVEFLALPKFSVYVELSENLLRNDPKIHAEIYGKYTFDKYVEGILNVELRGYLGKELIAQQTHHIDGLTVVQFHIENRQKLANINFLEFNVMLEDKHTGIQRNESRVLAIRNETYEISIPEDGIEFRYNKPYRLKSHIKHWISGPVRDSETPVILEHGLRSYKSYLNDKGTAIFEFDQVENAPYTVIFKDSREVLLPFHFYKNDDSDIFCRLTLNKSPRLGNPVEVEVRSSFNIPYLIYTVVGHATIIQMERVSLPPNTKNYTIKLIPSIEMIPIAFLYVHYILDGNLRYAEIELKFPMELENQISVEAPKQVKPGAEVTLKVKAEQKSYVSILAVDLSVYLLDHSYDLYKDRILEDLNYDRSYVADGEIVRPGIISGLITLTNAHHPIYIEEDTTVIGAGEERNNFRTKFPETWIFANYEINETVTEIVLNIPETITTWRITAFSNDLIKGFGIVDDPTDITTILPFFITLNLPYAVKRHELVAIPVTIFNYHNHSIDAEVSMFINSLEFQIIEDLSRSVCSEKQIKKIAQVRANGANVVKFLIKPSKFGEIELRIAAKSSVSRDGVVQKLKVIAEGITKYQNNARYISTLDKESSLALYIPIDSVNDSEIITLTVGGDFMIPAVENLNEMVDLPTGCGEQNMVNLAPNILVLDYLKATGQLSKEENLVHEAKFYTESGYQQELSYRHENGGYSVFGESENDEPSTWLTAYVIRFFIKASKYISVENRIIAADMEYLVEQQLSDGSFPYTGYLFYKELQNKYGFTAFVLLTFMEDRKYMRKYQTTVRKGLEYISSNLDDIDNVYALSIIAAALSKAKHASTNKVIEKLQSYRKEDNNGLVWWSGNRNDVETTAYVLLALLNVPGNNLPILKWLIKQRNSRGGFKSTHDTVVGLEALAKYAQKNHNYKDFKMKISYSAQDNEGNEVKTDEFLIDRESALTLQQHELPKSVRRVNFEITGDGYSFVQLSSQYNIKTDDELKYFAMKTTPTIYDSEQLDLNVCFTYRPLTDINNSTNMVIMEANLPSGYKAESEFSSELTENDFIQRIETKNDETTIILYFDKLSINVTHCVTIAAFRDIEVVDRKPAAIVMYDYYNTDRSNSLFYKI